MFNHVSHFGSHRIGIGIFRALYGLEAERLSIHCSFLSRCSVNWKRVRVRCKVTLTWGQREDHFNQSDSYSLGRIPWRMVRTKFNSLLSKWQWKAGSDFRKFSARNINIYQPMSSSLAQIILSHLGYHQARVLYLKTFSQRLPTLHHSIANQPASCSTTTIQEMETQQSEMNRWKPDTTNKATYIFKWRRIE